MSSILDLKDARKQRLFTLANELGGLATAFYIAAQQGESTIAKETSDKIHETAERGYKLARIVRDETSLTDEQFRSTVAGQFIQHARTIQGQCIKVPAEASPELLQNIASIILERTGEINAVAHDLIR